MTMQPERKSDRSGPRFGIALSGGGFRAAFFHIGVLARLAELDVLRQVQGISTVSGGSVVGAMYYLMVRRLLQSRRDDEVGPDDYIELVDELWRRFHDGVRHNLRMRTFANPLKNLRMYSHRYSRSDRMAELYTHYFYEKLVEPDLAARGVPLAGIRIVPKGEPAGFNPFSEGEDGRTPNDGRRSKVPTLLVNTTSLNTGHHFRFSPTWIGESPSRGSRRQIDLNTRLRRMYIDGRDRIPEKYARLPLGTAVAASAAVPGLFHPLALTDLYRQKAPDGREIEWTPQLVDGGVHDNQGVEALIDLGCTHLLVSDACGQMGDEPAASNRAFDVLVRSNSIMMDRVREEEYESAFLLAESGRIEEHLFLHMLEGQAQPSLTWIGGREKENGGPGSRPRPSGPAPGGMDRAVQRRLARIRTDLDSFTEVESHALMAAGYLIGSDRIDPGLGARLGAEPGRAASRDPGRWGFLGIGPCLRDPASFPGLARQLEVASRTAFKVVALHPALKWSSIAAAAAAVVAVVWLLLTPPLAERPFAPVQWLAARFPTNRTFGLALVFGGLYSLLFLLPAEVRMVASLRSLPRRLALRLATATLGCLAVWLHLQTSDRIFQRHGRIARLVAAADRTPEGSSQPGRP